MAEAATFLSFLPTSAALRSPPASAPSRAPETRNSLGRSAGSAVVGSTFSVNLSNLASSSSGWTVSSQTQELLTT